MRASASVTSLTGRASYRPDLRSIASDQVRAAREELGLGHDGFAAYLAGPVGWSVTAGVVARWEHGNVPPGDVLLACGGQVPAPSVLAAVAHAFTADTLSGSWLTCYQFSDPPKFRADIAAVTAISERRVRITNCPPAPRTQGHAFPFRNEIEAEVAGRQLAGSLEGADLSAVVLRDPAELFALAEGHTQYDAPLSLTALGEVA